MERIINYKYLGNSVNDNNKQSRELRTWIEITRQTFVEMKNKLEAFEMWCYRGTTKILWIRRVTNAEVLRR